MTIKAILAKIDEVDEKYRDLYTEQGGKWVLTGVEGVKTQADIDRLNGSLTKERKDHAETKVTLKTATDKLGIWEELDPEDVKAKLEKLGTYEAGNNVPELAKNFESTVAARVAQVVDQKVKTETTKLQRQLDTANSELATQKTAVSTYVEKDNRRTIHDAIQAEAVKAKVLPEALPDVLLVAGQELKLVDGKVLTEDGRDAAQVLEDYKNKRPYFWPQAVGAGARGGDNVQGHAGPNPFARGSWDMTKIGAMVAQEPAKAAKLAEAAGVPKNPDGTFKYHVMPPAAEK